MAVISISIVESTLQKVSGIPATIELQTNIPATIFYTLDGTEPTIDSSVAVGEIELPGLRSVILKVYATNGIDSSAVVMWTFGPSIVGNRNPRDTISGIDDGSTVPRFPYGTSNAGNPGIHGNIGGVIVDSATVTGEPTGYDGAGNPTAETDLEYSLENYDIIFSETNAIGERGIGIGTLPAAATVVIPTNQESPPVSSETNSPFFNPKALVIFQDSTEEPYDKDVSQIMRPIFDMSDPERTRNGALLFTTGLEGNPSRGSLLKQYFNPRDNTITYYYRDSETNRWIISKTNYVAKDTDVNNLSSVIFGSRQPGSQFVYQWLPFRYRRLY